MKFLILLAAISLSACSSNKDAETLAFCIEHNGLFKQSSYAGYATCEIDFSNSSKPNDHIKR